MARELVFTAVVGEPRVGKTHHVMKHEFLPSIKKLQKIYTTIDGVFIPECQAEIARQTGLSLEQVQELIVKLPRRREDLFKKGMFPDPVDLYEKRDNPDYDLPDSFIKAGSHIILDETSTLLDKQLPDVVMRYITEQGHFFDSQGNMGRMTVMQQSPKIYASTRDVLSSGLFLSKYKYLAPILALLRKIGIKKDYRGFIYTDMQNFPRVNKHSSIQHYTFDPEIFKTYKSHNGDAESEKSIDLSTTFLANKLTIGFGILILIMAIWAGKSLFNKFFAAFSDDFDKNKPVAQSTQNSVNNPTSEPSYMAHNFPNQQQQPVLIPNSNSKSKYFYVGSYTISENERVFIIWSKEDKDFLKVSQFDVSLNYDRHYEIIKYKGQELPRYHKSMLGMEIPNAQNNNNNADGTGTPNSSQHPSGAPSGNGHPSPSTKG